jgi:competence protein ComEC
VTTGEGSDIDIQLKEAAPLTMRARAHPSAQGLSAWILDQARAQADRWSLWCPVVFGCGCAAYFALKAEPGLALLAAISLGVGLVAWGLRRWGRAPVAAGVMLLAAFGAAGALSGKLQTLAMAGPISPALAGVTV